MSKIVKSKQPCPDREGCGSSDAYHEYDDGHGYCFSCSKYFKNNTKNNTKDIVNTSLQYINLRGISKDTMSKYKAKARVSPEGIPLGILFRYSDEIYKYRQLLSKDFLWIGKGSKDYPIFGLSSFPGGGRAVTITEGEFDAMSAYEMLGGYPCVSVRGSSSARNDVATCLDWFNTFEKIYICFDSDPVGEKAAEQVASLFDMNKVYIVKMSTKYKDANGYLEAGEEKAFKNAWYGAKKYMPKNVVASWQEVNELLHKKDEPAVGTYPFKTLEGMTYGIRPGEIVLLTAQEKVGKTEILRAIEHHLLRTTTESIGIIHLEESEKRSIHGLVGYELGVPVHLPDSGVSPDEIYESYKKLTGVDGRLHFYTHFGSDDPQVILDTIRFLATVRGCRFIFLDHITMVVTGLEEADERKKLDWLSTKLAMLVRELDFTLFLVSHVNDEGKTRGSRNIAKVSDVLIHLDRDVEASNIQDRNKTYVTVRGNRFSGLTGPAGILIFRPESFTIVELDQDIGEFDFNFEGDIV